MPEYIDPNQVVADLDQCESWLVDHAERDPDSVTQVSQVLLEKLNQQLSDCDCPDCEFAYMVTWYGMAMLNRKVQEHRDQKQLLKEMYDDESKHSSD